MISIRSRFALAVLAALAPTVAYAHGGSLLFLFLYFPEVVVAVVLIGVLWKWQATVVAKSVTAAVVVATSAALFATNYAIQYGAIRFPFGNGAYLVFVIAQIAIPSAVVLACTRSARRENPDREK